MPGPACSCTDCLSSPATWYTDRSSPAAAWSRSAWSRSAWSREGSAVASAFEHIVIALIAAAAPTILALAAWRAAKKSVRQGDEIKQLLNGRIDELVAASRQAAGQAVYAARLAAEQGRQPPPPGNTPAV
jgi:C4-dicarboxylate-specific signal transduction histidine kinase